jgi:hypothetical protein
MSLMLRVGNVRGQRCEPAGVVCVAFGSIATHAGHATEDVIGQETERQVRTLSTATAKIEILPATRRDDAIPL